MEMGGVVGEISCRRFRQILVERRRCCRGTDNGALIYRRAVVKLLFKGDAGEK